MIKTTIDFIGIDQVSINAEAAMIEKADKMMETFLRGREKICIDDHVLIDHVIGAQFDNSSFRNNDKQIMALTITTEDDAGSISVIFDPAMEYLDVTIWEHNICIDVKRIEK